MQEADRKDFYGFLGELAAYYDKSLLPLVYQLWWDDLCGYELADIRRAGIEHRQNLKDGKYFPRAANLIAYLQTYGAVKKITQGCFYHSQSEPCSEPAIVNVNSGHGNQPKFVCEKHFEKYHWVKTDAQKKFDMIHEIQNKNFKSSGSLSDMVRKLNPTPINPPQR